MKFINENKTAIAFAAALMILVSAAYFYFGAPGAAGMGGTGSSAIYDGMRYKVAYAPDGAMKLFALAKNNQLARFMAEEGNNLPEENSLVIGASEAKMMIGEKLISGAGSRLKGFFGINTSVEGILKKTGQPVDMLHFLSATQFAKIGGREGVVYSRLTDKKEPKMFFVYDLDDKPPFQLQFTEGGIGGFASYADDDGGKVCPIIIGADEAAMMRSEKMFSKAGDRLEGFFGNNVEIAGVLSKTNTSVDMFHFVSPDCEY
ncbi:MAG: hypothetical protein WCT52_01855 [Candidatus Micrarchaeia archaeon]